MKKNIAVINGDGIGIEVTTQSIRVLHAIAERYHHEFNYTYCLMGNQAIEKTGSSLPGETIEVCLNSDAILLGALAPLKYNKDAVSNEKPEQGLLKLRKSLQLFANVRPVTGYPSLQHLSPLKEKRMEGVDFIIFRELTGGIYFGKKEINAEQTQAWDECTYTASEIERIAHIAFKNAQLRRKKLTLVDKANVLATSGLWRKVVQQLAKQYSDVRVDYMFVDNAAMQIIINPKQFDIILTENMFGDILSDEASVINGSIGMLPAASYGVCTALFEPVIGSYPQAAGKDIVNPIGSILSAAMMLDYFQLHEEAAIVRQGVNWTLKNSFVTKDIDPINFYFTTTVGELISDYVTNKIHDEINRENIELRKSTII
jgi:3-isopropylmalate dehydrogenase